MKEVRIHFHDFLEMLSECDHPYHFEVGANDQSTLHLKLFVDGDPTDLQMLITLGVIEVTTEVSV